MSSHIPACQWHEPRQQPCAAYPTHTAEDKPQKTTYRLCAKHTKRYVELGCGVVSLGVKLYPAEILAGRISATLCGELRPVPRHVQLSVAEAEEILKALEKGGNAAAFQAIRGGQFVTPPWYVALEREKESK